MLRLALLLAVPVAVVGEGIALRVSDFEVGADGMLPAEKCFGGGNEYCVPRLEGVCAADRWCSLLPQSFFSTELGTVAGRAGTIPIVSESADPEGSKMAQLLSEDVMATMQGCRTMQGCNQGLRPNAAKCGYNSKTKSYISNQANHEKDTLYL